MPYKKKLVILGSIAVFLALVYVLTLFFDPARTNARNERFTWLPAGSRDLADRIEISRGEDKLELVFSRGKWVALLDGSEEVPVKQGRIDDIFRLLGTRGAFPHRGSSAASHEALGLDSSAARLVIRGGAGLPLLDLLVGLYDSSGREVFLRKSGENEVRSGDSLIGTYINGEKSAWYDLKLFDETPIAQVQRVRVNFNGYTGPEDETPLIGYIDYTISRSGDNWIMEGSEESLEKDRVEAWIQGILEASGENFLSASTQSGFTAVARISVELGDGKSLSLQIGPANPDGPPPIEAPPAFLTEGSPALTGGKPYMLLPRWTVTRLLRERGYFR